ncbi:hypothetical protein [Nitrosomonas sp.]|uniref:hypothetical protein n=1 Tax=Nitrosomonas sp. TaxID=42353 RepID=UPI00261D80F9|nr:hypothetical protein [Nitrosomonas sp.]
MNAGCSLPMTDSSVQKLLDTHEMLIREPVQWMVDRLIADYIQCLDLEFADGLLAGC